MAYVYNKVGSDTQSHQTPHFGFIDGDGDFIFDASLLASLETTRSEGGAESDPDIFIKAPIFSGPALPPEETVAETLKRLIANPDEKIQLDGFVSDLIRSALERLTPDKFPVYETITKEEFASRLQRYEDAILDVEVAAILLARWAGSDQQHLLEKIFARIAEAERPGDGMTLWLRLNSYPILLLMYAAGISALSANRNDALRTSLLTMVYADGRRALPIVRPVIDRLTDIADSFKMLPDMERRYVPRSEHIYRKLQPVLEDQLFLGRSYDPLFDHFEILLALSYSDTCDENPKEHVWGPPGRFAWKEGGRGDDPVYSNFVAEAKAEGEQWGPLQVGFFRRSAQRFSDIADAYKKLLDRISWW